MKARPRVVYSINGAGYSAGIRVLGDLRGSIGEGEVLVVTGPSGSGKTTLILAVTGALTSLLGGWVEGTVMLDNANPLSLEGFRLVPRLAGVVLQDPEKQLIMPTPLDEVAFTLENLGYSEREAEERAMSMLSRFGLKNKAHMHVEELSGGEKRRLTFASSIVHEPSLLILDEPTSSVDPWGIREIRRFMDQMRSTGSSILIVEHKLKYFLDKADEIIVLQEGGEAARIKGTPGSGEIEALRKIGVDAGRARITSRNVTGGRPVLTARSLAVGYGDKPLLSNVDLEVREGEILAIVGRNGCGKTTLLKTLAGALKPLEGEIMVEGEEMREIKPGKIFYVPQQPDYLFLGRSLRDELLKASRKSGTSISQLSSMIPWYEESINISPYRLSHGQRRWLSIIIAWGYKPRVILLDEPTTGLDYKLFRRLRDLVLKLAAGGTSFIISTHDPRVVGEIADRALLADGGKLREEDRARIVGMLEEEAGVTS